MQKVSSMAIRLKKQVLNLGFIDSIPKKFLVIAILFFLNIFIGYLIANSIFSSLNKNKGSLTKNNGKSKKLKFIKKIQPEFLIKFLIKYTNDWFSKVIKRSTSFLEIFEAWYLILRHLIKEIQPIFKLKKKIPLSKFMSKLLKELNRMTSTLIILGREVYLVFKSLKNEFLRYGKILPFFQMILLLKKLRRVLFLLMEEFTIIAGFIYGCYFIFTIIIGLIFGFSIGLWKYRDDINFWTLLYLLELIYQQSIKPVVLVFWVYYLYYVYEFSNYGDYLYGDWWQYIHWINSKQKNQIDKFSGNYLPEVRKKLPKIMLKKKEIPVPILWDPISLVDIVLNEKEPNSIEFEVIKFYGKIDEQVKPTTILKI